MINKKQVYPVLLFTVCIFLSNVDSLYIYSQDVVNEEMPISNFSMHPEKLSIDSQNSVELLNLVYLEGNNEAEAFFSASEDLGTEDSPYRMRNLTVNITNFYNPLNLSVITLKDISFFIVIEHCRIILNSTVPYEAIYIENSPHIIISDVEIVGGLYGIHSLDSPNIFINRTQISDFGRGGISLSYCSNATVSNSIVDGGIGNGIELYYCEGSWVKNNIVSHCKAYEKDTGNGIFLQMSNYCKVVHNFSSENDAQNNKNAGNGIFLEHSDYSFLEANYVEKNLGEHNSTSTGYEYPDLVNGGDFIADTTGIGIFIQSTYYTVIRHNFAANNSVDGFNFLFSDHGIFYNNTAVYSGFAGLSVIISYEAYFGFNWALAGSVGFNYNSRMARMNTFEYNFECSSWIADLEARQECCGCTMPDGPYPNIIWWDSLELNDSEYQNVTKDPNGSDQTPNEIDGFKFVLLLSLVSIITSLRLNRNKMEKK